MKAQFHAANTRGNADHGWLKSQHSFSFANYYNPERMGFGALRVVNDDIVAPSMGFGTHPHDNMEIISIPLSGALRHKDTMGNDFVIRRGEVQVMSAGTGIAHSEYNNSDAEETNFLQIWVIPENQGTQPRYCQKEFSQEERKDNFQLIVSPDGRQDSVEIGQQAFFSLVDISEGYELVYQKHQASNGVYTFVIEGSLQVNEHQLERRDALGLKEHNNISMKGNSYTEVLIMEVPLAW